MERAQQRFKQIGLNAFDDLIFRGESFNDVLGGVAQSIARMALQAALFGEGPMATLFGGGPSGSSGGGLFGMSSAARSRPGSPRGRRGPCPRPRMAA